VLSILDTILLLVYRQFEIFFATLMRLLTCHSYLVHTKWGVKFWFVDFEKPFVVVIHHLRFKKMMKEGYYVMYMKIKNIYKLNKYYILETRTVYLSFSTSMSSTPVNNKWYIQLKLRPKM